jgi:hypothetical protein
VFLMCRQIVPDVPKSVPDVPKDGNPLRRILITHCICV